jgi:imidazolonepropionase
VNPARAGPASGNPPPGNPPPGNPPPGNPPPDRVFTGISELYTPAERIEDAALVVADGRITWVGARRALPLEYRPGPTEHFGGRGVVPGLVDSHTHLVWAGSRLDDYLRRARGETYEAILEAGGGIHSTVEATRAASEDALFALARARAATLLATGVTTIEVKSGYGLLLDDEMKMLRVVARLVAAGPQRFVPTLLAHVVPTGMRRDAYVEHFTHEIIPAVAAPSAQARLAEAVDVFSDPGGFTLSETRTILEAAVVHGLRLKLHAEQIARTGAARLAAEMRALSADHLECATAEDWRDLAEAGTVGTLLPGASVVLRKPHPNARAMWDAGVKVAVATDHNPGSSPLYSHPLALQLAVALGGLSVEEALVAGTAHTADALARPDLGRLAPGCRADFVVMDSSRALNVLYRWGANAVRDVYIGGQLVHTVA